MMAGVSTRAAVFNVTAPGANTDILTTALTPQYGAMFQVTVALTVSSVFNVTITDGTTTHTWALNDGTALGAAELYTFSFGVHPTETNSGSGNTLSYNFQVATDGVIEYMQVNEVAGSAGGLGAAQG